MTAPLRPRRLPKPDAASPKALGQNEGRNPCVVCGREVAWGNAGWQVQMATDGLVVDYYAVVENSLGCFLLGQGCLKRHKWLQPYAHMIVPAAPR